MVSEIRYFHAARGVFGKNNSIVTVGFARMDVQNETQFHSLFLEKLLSVISYSYFVVITIKIQGKIQTYSTALDSK